MEKIFHCVHIFLEFLNVNRGLDKMKLCYIIENWREKSGDLRFGQWLYAILNPIKPECIDNETLVGKISEETGIILPEIEELLDTTNLILSSRNQIKYDKNEILELFNIIRSFKTKPFGQWISDISKPMDLFYIEDDDLIDKINGLDKYYIVIYNDTKILLAAENLPMSECETIEDYYDTREVIAKFISEEEAVEGVKNLIMETAINDCAFKGDVRKEFKNIKIVEIKEIKNIDINGQIFDEVVALKNKQDEEFKKYKIEQLEKELEKWKNQ